VAAARDREEVARLLGRPPMGSFEVVVRDAGGGPVVIRNVPLLEDGTPMPTRYWLVGAAARLAVDRLESSGGVRAAEAAVDPLALAAAHAAYAAERDAEIPSGWTGPRPAGGVGGTRTGVKCLHAHYAWHLAGGKDPVGRWVAAQLAPAGAPSRAFAAIDCGTNSTRLLVSGADGAPVERLMRITRLGRGVDRDRRLAPAAIERTVAVLRDYRAVMDGHGVEHVRMTATSAARDATNREEFFAAAAEVIGVRPELLSGDEEGRLSFAGATAELARETGPWLVVDIGGGSTELIVGPGADGGPIAVRSLDVGCVRLTERYLTSDPPAPAQVAHTRRQVATLLEQAERDEPQFRSGRTLVGLAGTVAALAAIDQGLEGYDRARVHHYLLRRGAVERWLATLAGEPAAARRRRPGMESERADVIVGGTVALAEVMRHFDFDRCLTSEADILDGLVASLRDG
jgi:exopolyphosphatase/guanosine-5'-triphosphate,3'-diphosphate pyrophosphatase